jgi:O-antigen ligase
MRWLRGIFFTLIVVFIAAYGGTDDYAKQWFALGVLAVLFGCIFALRSHLRLASLRWWFYCCVPLVLLPVVQIIPFGFAHPWVHDDAQALAISPLSWSIIPAATFDSAYWALLVASILFTATLLWRGERAQALMRHLVWCGAGFGVLGFFLVLGEFSWPNDTSVNRVRGPFIYPNHAAAFWTALLPLALVLARGQKQIAPWFCVAIIALSILFSASRGGILVACVVVLPFAWSLLPQKKRWWWASGGVSVIAGWLWFIGISDVITRFEQLRGEDGVTLNGRLTIWENAWPIIHSAGALGSGAGTTTEAYRRAGDTYFTDVIVNHLHNDALQWWLEYGWIGIICLVAVLLWLGFYLVRNRPTTNSVALSWRAAGCGLVALVLHSVGDFIWHSPALILIGCLLLVICLQLSVPDTKAHAEPRPSRWLRWHGFALVALLAAWWWPWFTQAQANIIARDAERQSLNHNQLAHGAALQNIRERPTTTIRLARAQAWLALHEQRFADAENILAQAAHVAPGDAACWMLRALLHAQRGKNNQHVQNAVQRALHWAPTWPEIQTSALFLARYGVYISTAQQQQLYTALFAQNRAQPAWFFLQAAEFLGPEVVSARIAQGPPHIIQSGEPWLAQFGQLSDWLSARKKIGPPAEIPLWLTPTAELLYGAAAWRHRIPPDVDERRAHAIAFIQAGMQLPAAWRDVLQRDGPLSAWWSEPHDLLLDESRAQLTDVLRTELHRSWVRSWSDHVRLITQIKLGDTQTLGRSTDPELLTFAAGIHPVHRAPETIIPAERERLGLMLERYREWEWQEPVNGVRWSYRYHTFPQDIIIESQTWTAVFINGTWLGWMRGRQNIGPLSDSGLHRVVCIQP